MGTAKPPAAAKDAAPAAAAAKEAPAAPAAAPKAAAKEAPAAAADAADAAPAAAPKAAAPKAAAAAAAAPKAFPTALAALESNKDLTTFVRAAEIAGLKPYLAAPVTRATIFAPTNAAFAKLVAALKLPDAKALEAAEAHLLIDRLIGYHVLTSGSVASKAIKDGAAVTTASGHGLTLGATKGAVTVKGAQNSATVTAADLQGGNVTIHVIDEVLLPPTVFATIKDALAFSPTTSTLSGLIAKDAALAKAAADPTTNVTLFAPYNKALDAVAASAAGKAILADPKATAKVLAYHAVKGARIFPGYLAKGAETLPTLLDGQSVEVYKEVTPKADGNVGAVVIEADSTGAKPVKIGKHNIIAGASLIHIIDGVLIPKLGSA